MKKCPVCRKEFVQYNSLQKVCSAKCEKKLNIKTKTQSTKQKKELRKNTFKSFGKHTKELQDLFNTWIKIRDKRKGCITCDTPIASEWHAGHFISVGANTTLRFEPSNVHKQCSKCNITLGGNRKMYEKNLPKRIGQEQYDWLMGPHEANHYSVNQLIALKTHYKRLIKTGKGGSKL
ncbi:recombination protein NinG [Glaciecola sp. 2405UD65-10]|uniref:recombination protein NinG n=1 Tax=Glaciecola sp. 2405UD65-10 TaxID=3397244 RepID=UPI003B5B9443